jgi:PAS domain S-box-containing protein
MDDTGKTKEQLIQELEDLRRRIDKLEESETESRRVEKALIESENKYRSLFENASEAIFVVQDGKIVFLNPMVTVMSGYSVEELTTKPFTEFIYLDDRDMVIDRYFRRLNGENVPQVYPYRVIRKGGNIRWGEVNVVLISWKGDKATLNFMVDITERKRAEESLRQSEERYRTILENMEEGYSEVDLKGNITFLNESFRKHLGYTKEELLGMNYRKYFDQENAQKAFKAYNQVYKTGKPLKQVEWEMIRKDGTKRITAVSISLIKDASNQAIGFRSIGRDETERKKGLEALKKSEKDLRLLSNRLIKAQEKEQKRIAIELHDDLGQSLVGLKMRLSGVHHRLEENQTELKQEIKQAAESIDLMTGNVRRISRDLRPSVLEHMGLIEALQWLFEYFTTTHKIKIEKEIAIPKVSFSKNQEIIIFRIFQEALTNIVKHAQATQIFIDLKKEGRTAVFSIKDNGRGFNLEEVKGKKSYESGIGLIAMKERATMAGGDLEINSQTGNGTLITFWVPIKRIRKK